MGADQVRPDLPADSGKATGRLTTVLTTVTATITAVGGSAGFATIVSAAGGVERRGQGGAQLVALVTPIAPTAAIAQEVAQLCLGACLRR